MHSVVVWFHLNKQTACPQWEVEKQSTVEITKVHQENVLRQKDFLHQFTVNKLSTDDFVLALFLSLTFEYLMACRSVLYVFVNPSPPQPLDTA